MTDVGTVERVCCRQEVIFDWKIEDFSQIYRTTGGPFYSPFFDFGGVPWYLELEPPDELSARSKGHVGLHLWCDDPRPPPSVQFSLGFRSATGETAVEVTYTHAFRGAIVCGSRQVIETSELFRRSDELLPRDVLSVRATLKAELPFQGTTDVSVQTTEGIAAKDGKAEQLEKRDPATTDVSVQTEFTDMAAEDEKRDVQGGKTESLAGHRKDVAVPRGLQGVRRGVRGPRRNPRWQL